MISLNVEEKCQNFPNFYPDVEKIDASTIDGEKNIIQTVYCREKDFCKYIEEYLKNS